MMSHIYSESLSGSSTTFAVLGPFAPGEVIKSITVTAGNFGTSGGVNYWLSLISEPVATVASMTNGYNLVSEASSVPRLLYCGAGSVLSVPVGVRVNDVFRWLAVRIVQPGGVGFTAVVAVETDLIKEI